MVQKSKAAKTLNCANCRRIGRETNDPPYYKVPFIYGGERICMEWHCKDCIDEDEAFEWRGEDLYLYGAEVEEIQERYVDGDTLDDILVWP